MSNIPVVLVHKGRANYLRFAIKQASHFHNDVILLGDNSNADFCDRHFQYDNFKSGLTSRLGMNYEHMSPNPYEFELVCLERWFVLLELMKVNSLDRIFYIDSDVLLYCNIDKALSSYSGLQAALCSEDQEYEDYKWFTSGHCSFWTIKLLEEFCEFVLDNYSNKERLYKKWNWHKQTGTPGGICDMTLLYLFYNSNGDRILNLSSTLNSMIFDNGIGSDYQGLFQTETRSFPSKVNMRRVSFEDGQPYSITNEGNRISFKALHFSSGAKIYMPFFLSYSGSIMVKIKTIASFGLIYLKHLLKIR